MIDKETFRRIEKKLYNYFKKDKKIASLKRKIDLLNKQIYDIEKKLRNTDVNIPEERVQGSDDCTSYAEKTLMRITDNLLMEQSRKIEEIAELKEQIRDIEADNIIIEDNIKDIRRR